MIQSDLAKKRRERIIRYAPLLLWIGVILFASTSQASMSNTSRFIRPFLDFFFPNTPEETLVVYQGFVRKIAHLCEYTILALLAARAFSSSSVNFLQRFWFAASLALVFFIASLDEYNQSFNSLRTGSIYDVLLDVSGGLLMIIILRVCRVF